jgi:hypothetical protein
MSFRPDIFVRDPDIFSTSLVAGVLLENEVPAEVEQDLKYYMLQTHCSVGVIVTPSRVHIYKDDFSSQAIDSIKLVGSFPTQDLLGSGSDLKTRVQLESQLLDWLDRLADASYFSGSDPVMDRTINRYIVPAVSGQDVAFAHPGSV